MSCTTNDLYNHQEDGYTGQGKNSNFTQVDSETHDREKYMHNYVVLVEAYMERIANAYHVGFLSNGMKYVVNKQHFNFYDFYARNNLELFGELDYVLFADTPTEAAEHGVNIFFSGSLRQLPTQDSLERGIKVSYCEETNNWVLEYVFFFEGSNYWPTPLDIWFDMTIFEIWAVNRYTGITTLYYVHDDFFATQW